MRNPAAGKAFESRMQSGEHARLTGIFADYSEEVRHSGIRYVGERINNPFIGESEIISAPPFILNLSQSPRVVNRNHSHGRFVKNIVSLGVFGLSIGPGRLIQSPRGAVRTPELTNSPSTGSHG